MGKFNLSLVRRKLQKLRSESSKFKYMDCKKINENEFLEYLRSYIGEIEEDSEVYDYKRNKLVVVLVSEFLSLGKRILNTFELRMDKKESQKRVMSELNKEIGELLVITSNYAMEVSKNNYLRGLVSTEFPKILVYLLYFASSGLIEIKTRCKLLKASVNLLEHKNNSKISESSNFRTCLYLEDEFILKRLWKSMCREIIYSLSEFNISNNIISTKKVSNEPTCSDDDVFLLISHILDIYCNILHYNRFLTDKVLLKNCIYILTENVKILLELAFSSSSNVSFKGLIILRSLLLDTENCKFMEISNYFKESGYILLLLVSMLREIIANKDINIIVNNWVLLGQIMSILSQNDDDIFDLLNKLFPKKFLRIFNDKWFINKKIDRNIVLPWFPKNCDWYDINTNILLDDVNGNIIKHNSEVSINSLNINEILYYGKRILNDVMEIIDINMNHVQDIILKYNNIINRSTLDNISYFDKEYTIRRYPDYTWYIFWELCKNDYEDQLDLIWNNEIKKELISALSSEFNRIRSYSKKTRIFNWNIKYYHPNISLISKELIISDSCYLRLLIPTLKKIDEKFGLFNLLSETRFGSNLSLIERRTKQVGHIYCYVYNKNKLRIKNINDSINKHSNDIIDICNKQNNNINNLFNTIKCKFNIFHNTSCSIMTNINSNKNKEISDKLLLTENKYILNNDYSDWEIVEKDYDILLLLDKNNLGEINKYLDDKLMNILINSRIPYIECIENCEKVRLLFSSLFQKIISENTFLIKSYMLYCYVHYLLVFNEYIMEQQLVDHIQYFLMILTSTNCDDNRYRYHVIYITHIILTLYEKVRKEFINIGGLNIINEIIIGYQKNWSISRQLNIYLQDETINDIINEVKFNKENSIDNGNLNWDKYVSIFSSEERNITNYKLMLNNNTYNEINYSRNYNNVNTYDHYEDNNYYTENLNQEENIEIFIMEKPDLTEIINNGIIYNEVLKLITDKSEKEKIEIKSHIQLMNIWLLLINDNEINITLKDYLRLYDENNIIVSEIPSRITTNNCVTPKSKISNYFDLINMEDNEKEIEYEDENKSLEKKTVDTVTNSMCFSNLKNIYNIENIIKIMNDNDLINYNELIIWLITINNCLIQSNIWVSIIIDNKELVSNLIRIILIKNKLLNIGYYNNYHIFLVCKILIKLLKVEKNIILKYIDNNLVEVLLFTLLRYESNQLITKNNSIVDYIILLLKNTILTMNEIIQSDDSIKEINDKNNIEIINNKGKCNKNCNIINGCVYGDTICLIFNIMKKIKSDNNMEISELRMINIFGFGVYYLSKYLPISLIEILINRKNNINLFKEILLYDNNTSIKIKWNKISRIRILIDISNKLLNIGLNIDISENNIYNEYCNINNDKIKGCIEIIDQYNYKNNGLNIYGYNINKMLDKIIDINNKTIKSELFINKNGNIYDNWLLKSRENRDILMELIEMDYDNITLIYKYYYLKKDNNVLNNNAKKYQNIWNMLNYYLCVYFMYYIIKRNENMNDKNNEIKCILENILNIIKLQFNLIIIGISYIKDDNMLFIKDNNELKLNMDTIFDQFIDKYYQYNSNNNNNNSKELIYIHENINEIIYNNNLMEEYNQFTVIFLYNLKILNIIKEINPCHNINYSYYENNILINSLSKIKKIKNNKNKILCSSLLIYLLFNDNNDNELINLLLYSVLLKNKCNNNNKSEYEDEKLILILVEYIMNNEFKNINSVTLILILNIIKINVLNKDIKIKIVKKGIIPKFFNELNIEENSNIYNKINNIIIEIIIILYNNKNNNIIVNILNSILTPSLCDILDNCDNNNFSEKVNTFKKILSSDIITSGIIWTRNMYTKLKEWCEEEMKIINNNKNNNFDWLKNMCIIDFKERYYKVVNDEINTNNDSKYYYDYKKEEYVYGVNILYYALEDKLLKKEIDITNEYETNVNNDNVTKVIDYLCDKIRLNNEKKLMDNIYIYCIYKLIMKHGINVCFLNNLSLKKNVKILLDCIYILNMNKEEIIISILLNNIEKKRDDILEYVTIDNSDHDYYLYILEILGITELNNNKFKLDNIIILMESKIILMNIIEYIKEKYIFTNLNNNNNNIMDLLIKLINKLILFNNITNNNSDRLCLNKIKYEYNKIKYIICIFKLLFWYDYNLDNIENNKIKEIVILSIKIIKEEMLYDIKNNKDGRIMEITEIIIYPLCENYYKKIKNVLNIDLDTILNKNMNFTNILINSKKPTEFLEWFISENNNNTLFIINWNKKTRDILYINIQNIHKKLQNITYDNKISDLFIKIKDLCKNEYYKNILNYNRYNSYIDIYQLKISNNDENNEISCYIVLLLTIKEVNNLMVSLNTLINSNKRLDIIVNVIIMKYRLILKLIGFININKVLINICNKTVKKNNIIDNIEYMNNTNKDSILSLIQDEIENISNIHPNIRNKSKIKTNNNIIIKKGINENNYLIINETNKLYMIILMKNILGLILFINEKKVILDIKLTNVISEIIINIMLVKFLNNCDNINCNSGSLYIILEQVMSEIILLSDINDNNNKSSEIKFEINNLKEILNSFDEILSFDINDNSILPILLLYIKYIKSIDNKKENDNIKNKIIELIFNFNKNTDNGNNNNIYIDIDTEFNYSNNAEDPIYKALTIWE
ncbi:hypothetical protein FG386_001035 [Cryptosporidium ryanae]|uniref:uncharacterized protein n=1 Tax=Cryptosporidium ryanae TaxID=515981 RepID=UPI003519D8FC|nr:hypothetical protein FG386_001035 [Cryptosporidium ryanae]